MLFNKFVTLVLLIFIFTTITLQVKAETTVNFNKPEKFTDFKTMVNLSAKDREMLMNELRELMIKSVVDILPKGNNMLIMINNIDMAGGFMYGKYDLFRVVRDTDRMRFDFSYRMLDASGVIVREDKVHLTSRNPKVLKRETKKYNHSHFAFEMILFDNWLRDLDKI